MLQLTTLGGIDLRDQQGQPLREVLAQPKRVALLVYLAVEGRRGPVSRDRILGLFWPESDESRARNTLSQALHHLRQALGADVIESQGTNALGIRADGLWCDANAFADALERGDVDQALDLYPGDFCPSFFASGMPELEQWLDAQRRRLRGQALSAARARAEGLAGQGDEAGAVRAARRALSLEPNDEADVRALISLLDQSGDRTGALHAYQEYARRLATTLEAEPEPETRQLVEAIRRRVSKAEAAVVVEGPGSRDQGTGTDAHPVPPPRRHGRRAFALASVGVVLVALIGAVALRGKEHPVAPPIRTIAVMPFTLRAGAPHAYLRDGMVDLLCAKLGEASGFQVIDPRSIIAAVGDKATGPEPASPSEIARRLGAGWYISGEVIEVAGRLQLNGTLHQSDGTGRTVASSSVVGDTAALFELVDDLTGRMLAGLTAGRDTSVTRLAAITTHSLPALKAFLEGERALREGREAQAAAAYRTASSIDTGFALAQYRLAITATWVSVPEAANPTEWAALAARHAGRLSPMGRDLLNAFRAYKEINAEAAERAYRELTESHPNNVEAWFMLGETRFHYYPLRGRSPSAAWPAFQRVLALDPTNLHAMLHLARLAAWDGRVAELDSLTQQFLAASKDAGRGLEIRALKAYVHDDLKERAAIAAAAKDADDRVVIALLQAAILYAQNLDAARELAQPFLQTVTDSIARTVGLRNLTEIDLAAGEWNHEQTARWLGNPVNRDWRLETEAILAGDPAFDVPRERIAAIRDSVAARNPYPALLRWREPNTPDLSAETRVYLLGLLDLRLGDTAAASRAADQLLSEHDGSRSVAVRELGHAIRAELARSRGDYRQALGELGDFTFDLSTPWTRAVAHWGLRERFLKAEMLRQQGKDEEALGWYESFQGPYDLPYIPLGHLRQAEIHRKLGHKERAEFHLGRWKSMVKG